MHDHNVQRIGVSRIHFPVTTLGPGTRAAIWFQGCSLGCSGCVSSDTWPSATDTAAVGDVVDHVADLSNGRLDGLTISGGEPFDQPDALFALLKDLRTRDSLDHIDILLYTGYYLSVISRRKPAILEMIDAVIDGPFIEAQPSALPIAGSSNQRLHLLTDLGRSRFEGNEGLMGGLQVAVSGNQIWFAGVPKRGEMERVKAEMASRGVEIGAESWRP